MIYQYKCEKCNKPKIVIKPMSESSREEKCEDCGQVMTRVYTSPSIKTGDGLK